jgi:hypothetical protein
MGYAMIAFRRVRLVILLLTCLLGVSVIPASPVLAATECASTVTGVTIQDNLIVPNGAECYLSGSTVTGNVTVSANAVFFAENATSIGGKVSGEGVALVYLGSSTVVQGNVSVAGATYAVGLFGIRVGGNLTLIGNNVSDGLAVSSSTIGGNLTVWNNTSAVGIAIIDTAIRGNLSCEGNALPPGGGGNVVSGRKSGQCASL